MSKTTRRATLVVLAGLVAVTTLGLRHRKQETFTATPQQLTGARFVVESLASVGAVREWDRPKAVFVDSLFQTMSLEQRQNACRALDVVRQTKGLKPGFDVREASHRHKLGRYRNGTLEPARARGRHP